MYSIIIPVYRNEASLLRLIERLDGIAERLPAPLEVVFVVDGSPDGSHALLRGSLPTRAFSSQLLRLSRNFGSFPAIREGLRAARGSFLAVMAADLQEPPELVCEFFEMLESGSCDIAMGVREARSDPALSRTFSQLFWASYRRFVQPEMPEGGVDVFGCTTAVRDQLLGMEAVRTSLVGQLVWLGFRVRTVPYSRLEREHGTSGWSWAKKWAYLEDSFFSFTDAPIRILLASGGLGLLLAFGLGVLILATRLAGGIDVPGYTATVFIVLFFAALNLLGFGIVGSYAFRAYENTKGRPAAVVMDVERSEGKQGP